MQQMQLVLLIVGLVIDIGAFALAKGLARLRLMAAGGILLESATLLFTIRTHDTFGILTVSGFMAITVFVTWLFGRMARSK